MIVKKSYFCFKCLNKNKSIVFLTSCNCKYIPMLWKTSVICCNVGDSESQTRPMLTEIENLA